MHLPGAARCLLWRGARGEGQVRMPREAGGRVTPIGACPWKDLVWNDTPPLPRRVQ